MGSNGGSAASAEYRTRKSSWESITLKLVMCKHNAETSHVRVFYVSFKNLTKC